MYRPGEPPSLPLLHYLHDDCPPPICCHGNKLPAQQDVSRQPQLVYVAHVDGGGVLGYSLDGYECTDSRVGGVATDRAV